MRPPVLRILRGHFLSGNGHPVARLQRLRSGQDLVQLLFGFRGQLLGGRMTHRDNSFFFNSISR